MNFSQLFGEVDPDQDVSPDTEDPEAAGDAGQSAAETVAKSNGTGQNVQDCVSLIFIIGYQGN